VNELECKTKKQEDGHGVRTLKLAKRTQMGRVCDSGGKNIDRMREGAMNV
jgi:hypothetical protein